uniref:Uncharacterized protein n=1 Tax=Arcella intermedia TaxID=1963864 RepID=A0A6B2LJ37_9EUKA
MSVPITLNPKYHPLKQPYSFWFMKRQGQRSQENYEKSIKQIGTFGTVEDFWAYYNHLLRPNDLPYACDYHLFRDGVKPMWEDDENKQGGKFIVRITRGKRTSSRFWEDILLAVVGGQFDVPDDEICGVVISTRYQKDILSLWNKHAESIEEKKKIHDTIKRVLNLPQHVVLEYKHHDQSIKDNSSFRNTEKAQPWTEQN